LDHPTRGDEDVSKPTQYGFAWGPMRVERMAHIEGRGYVVSVHGPKGYNGPQVQVFVSEKGRTIRAFPLNGAKVAR
jgi:hypothetical protein